MGTNSGKLMTTLILSFILTVYSCQFDNFDNLQVYDYDGTPLKSSYELVGLPLVRLDSGYHPWKLYGRIVNGKMDIDFPNVKLELGSKNIYSTISIERKNSNSMKFALHDIKSDFSSKVYIFYSTENHKANGFRGSENEIALKAGWNFVEELLNPKWAYGNDEPYYIIGLISQDINDFFRKGYRWYLEIWI